MTIPFPIVQTTNSYELSLREVKAVRSALLISRSPEWQGSTGITVSETVELERKFIWREP